MSEPLQARLLECADWNQEAAPALSALLREAAAALAGEGSPVSPADSDKRVHIPTHTVAAYRPAVTPVPAQPRPVSPADPSGWDVHGYETHAGAVDGGRLESPEAAVPSKPKETTVAIETLEQVIAKLEALYEKWTEHSRNLNHDGKRELESYYDGKREGLREAAHEVWYAKQKLEALIRQETEQ